MPDTKQSNTTGKIGTEAALFINAFCRTDLSIDDIMLICDLFEVTFSTELSSMEKRDIVQEVLRERHSF